MGMARREEGRKGFVRIRQARETLEYHEKKEQSVICDISTCIASHERKTGTNPAELLLPTQIMPCIH